jgi:hypothetical protein
VEQGKFEDFKNREVDTVAIGCVSICRITFAGLTGTVTISVKCVDVEVLLEGLLRNQYTWPNRGCLVGYNSSLEGRRLRW